MTSSCSHAPHPRPSRSWIPSGILQALCLAASIHAVTGCAPEPEQSESDLQALGRGRTSVHETLAVSGLVLGLRHNMHQDRELGQYVVGFTTTEGEAIRMEGGDLESDTHRGFEWWMLPDWGGDPSSLRLPPGVLVTLKHSQNQAGRSITAFGHDAVAGPATFPGFRKQFGGDLGAPAGHGYFWYESTGEDADWSLIDRLPRYTVVGLKHTHNQRDKAFIWNGVRHDPADATIPPPAGFERRVSRDSNHAGRQAVYAWYEKVAPGREIVVRPHLSVTYDRSPFLSPDDDPSTDGDGDGVRDEVENALAELFRPLLKFDSSEKARQPFEPLTLFQVRPKAEGDWRVLRIKWAFLFGQDGGYGPSAHCWNGHPGDNDTALFEFESLDQLTWTLRKVEVGWKGHGWPANTRLEVHALHRPIIYMSGSKHHQYLTRDRDHKDSLYTGSVWICNDDVDGRGAAVIPDLRSVDGVRFNNVGEPEQRRPAWPFIDDLGPHYPGHSAWETIPFYHPDSAANANLWLRD